MAFGFKKLVAGLKKTRDTLSDGLSQVLGRESIDEATLEDLEYALLAADVGPDRTQKILDSLKKNKGEAAPREIVRAELLESLVGAGPFKLGGEGQSPRVVFVVGVNGGGKTTTVGKLAASESAKGKKVLTVAADTFRAAAVDQLARWTERANVTMVRRPDGSDPASVVYQALEQAKAGDYDLVLVDTAGRLHTKANLMAELEKLTRVAGKVIEGAPHQSILVVDATTGQNGLQQAKAFTEAAALDAVVLTKLDGTAKGGVALGITEQLNVPVAYVGVGEGVDDLLPFSAEDYVEGLLGQATAQSSS